MEAGDQLPATSYQRGNPVTLDYAISLIVSIAMLAYLVAAMLKPEKF